MLCSQWAATATMQTIHTRTVSVAEMEKPPWLFHHSQPQVLSLPGVYQKNSQHVLSLTPFLWALVSSLPTYKFTLWYYCCFAQLNIFYINGKRGAKSCVTSHIFTCWPPSIPPCRQEFLSAPLFLPPEHVPLTLPYCNSASNKFS